MFDAVVLDQANGYHIAFYMYFRSGSSLSRPSIVFSYLQRGQLSYNAVSHSGTYIVKTIPPLSTNLASRGTAPDQKVKTPSDLNIFAAHTKLFLYSFRASMDCILRKVNGCE